MNAVLLWLSPNVVGGAVLERSLAHAWSALGCPRRLVRWTGDAVEPGAGLLLIVAGFASDVRAAAAAIAAAAGLVPADRILRVLCPTEGGLSAAEVRVALGAEPRVWPADPRALARADRDGMSLQETDARSRLTAAVHSAAEAFAVASPSVAPPLDPSRVAREVSERVWSALDGGGGDGVEAAIDRELASFLAAQNGVLSSADRDQVRRRLRQELVGFGPIEPFFEDPAVSEIMVNGAGRIFVERDGRMERAPAVYASEDRLRLAISRIVSPAGRRVDLSSPLCDVRLPDGSRANVVLPPVSVGGPVLTVRRFRPAFSDLDDLVRAGAVSPPQVELLRQAVRDRRNILIAGNSGAGKTTLLNALAGLIPDEERIITMEDAAELRIRKPHVVRLETRPPNAEGAGEVSMRDLVINALRMRPDRLVVGECRGAEAVPMLQAMNTGHDGSMTTLHANSAADAMDRLESMVLIGAPHWPSEVVRRQIFAAIHLVVFLRRAGAARRVESIQPIEALRR